MTAGTYCVYILASRSRCLYVGCTSNLARRLAQHRAGVFRGFTARYRIFHLVYFECASDPRAAVRREREIKGWRRERKMALVESINAGWRDLAPEGS